MSSPGIRPRNNTPAAGGQHVPTIDGKRGSKQMLRVLSEEGVARAVPSIAMPRATTELSELLAGDDLLCARRPRSATTSRPSADARPPASAADGASLAESSQTHAADGDLACLIDAWPKLPRNVRAAILAMIRETAADDA